MDRCEVRAPDGRECVWPAGHEPHRVSPMPLREEPMPHGGEVEHSWAVDDLRAELRSARASPRPGVTFGRPRVLIVGATLRVEQTLTARYRADDGELVAIDAIRIGGELDGGLPADLDHVEALFEGMRDYAIRLRDPAGRALLLASFPENERVALTRALEADDGDESVAPPLLRVRRVRSAADLAGAA